MIIFIFFMKKGMRTLVCLQGRQTEFAGVQANLACRGV